MGSPGPQSPVLVTANYKLSFDALRHRLGRVDAWLLIVDTRGINVWCAAGKSTFSAEEVCECVRRFRLGELVSHRQLILPQLAAPGVAAQAIRKGCGFSALFGPVRAADVETYLANGLRCDEAMRTVTFSLAERAVLIPVELFLVGRSLLIALASGVLLSGLGPTVFSPTAALERGLLLLAGAGFGLLGGAVLTPLLLPWLPARQFWFKGVIAALPLLAVCGLLGVGRNLGAAEQAALALWTIALSSYLAMNFTGSTPFTSLSGVEYEMRRGLPVQLGAAGLALILWLAAPFC